MMSSTAQNKNYDGHNTGSPSMKDERFKEADIEQAGAGEVDDPEPPPVAQGIDGPKG